MKSDDERDRKKMKKGTSTVLVYTETSEKGKRENSGFFFKRTSTVLVYTETSEKGKRENSGFFFKQVESCF
jgi:hypothetical protein